MIARILAWSLGIGIILGIAASIWFSWQNYRQGMARRAWYIRHVNCGPQTATRLPAEDYLGLDYCGPWCDYDPLSSEPRWTP